MSQRHSDAAGTSSEIDDESCLVFQLMNEGGNSLDQKLSFGSRNKDIGSDDEIKTVELLMAGDVLYGLAPRSSFNKRKKPAVLTIIDFLVRSG